MKPDSNYIINIIRKERMAMDDLISKVSDLALNCADSNKNSLKSDDQYQIIDSKYQNKEWRKSGTWYKTGKNNECELYQKNQIKNLIGIIPEKTHDRLNMDTNEINDCKNPNTKPNGFDITENFDGKIINGNNTIYFNYKMVCDSGGAQTRTLREVYHFIKCQIAYLIKIKQSGDHNHNNTHYYFINILDGDTSYQSMDKFTYLLEKHKQVNENIENSYLFVGSMYSLSQNATLLQKIKNI